MDKNLWPSRGAITLPGGGTASPDERLLFPTDVVYAPSGRFAVGIHTGASTPTDSSPEPHEGGAVSFINDGVISVDLAANASATAVPNHNGVRPYYSMMPICEVANRSRKECITGVVNTVFDYKIGGQPRRFNRPRGVAIVPNFSIVTPRFGDHIDRTGEITLRWNSTAQQVTYRLFHLGPASGPDSPAVISAGSIAVGSSSRSLVRPFTFFHTFGLLVPMQRYRLEATLEATLGILGTASIDFVVIR